MDALAQLFHGVCGQNPLHTWMAGELAAPCCQRCTGLYVGVCAAFLLHRFLRPQLTSRFLEVHGLLLLLMIPCGFHWVPQGPILRALSGVGFGFGVVTYLWLAIDASPIQVPGRAWHYALGLVAALVGVPLLGTWGGKAGMYLLAGLTTAGALILAGLCLAALFAASRFVVRTLALLIRWRSSP